MGVKRELAGIVKPQVAIAICLVDTGIISEGYAAPTFRRES
jgi:hypothetical protein